MTPHQCPSLKHDTRYRHKRGEKIRSSSSRNINFIGFYWWKNRVRVPICHAGHIADIISRSKSKSQVERSVQQAHRNPHRRSGTGYGDGNEPMTLMLLVCYCYMMHRVLIWTWTLSEVFYESIVDIEGEKNSNEFCLVEYIERYLLICNTAHAIRIYVVVQHEWFFPIITTDMTSRPIRPIRNFVTEFA